MSLSIQSIKAIIIYDSDGEMILSKYYKPYVYEESAVTRATFERNLFALIRKSPQSSANNNEVTIAADGRICIYRSNIDLVFCVIGEKNENLLMISCFLQNLFDAIMILLKKNAEKKMLLENMDMLFIVIDEMCDEGVILDIDASAVAARACSKNDEINMSEQTVAQVIQSAKEQIKWSFLK